MPPAIQINGVSIRHLDSNRNRKKSHKLKKADVFLRFIFKQSPLHETTSCKTSASDSWRQWDTSISIHDFNRFTVQVVRKRIFHRNVVLGHVDVDCASFAVVDTDATCEKTFTLTSADGNPPTLKITIAFSGLRIKTTDQVPGEPEIPQHSSLKSPERRQETLLESPTLSVTPAVDAGVRLREVNDHINSARKVTSGPPKWVEKFDKSRGYMDIVVQMVESIAELHPMAKIAVKALTMAYDVVKQEADIHDSLQSLVSSMEEMLAALAALHDFHDVLDKIKILEDTIEHVIKNVEACADFICKYSQRNFPDKMIWQPLTKDRIEELKASFSTLRLRLIEAVGVQNLQGVYDSKAIGVGNLKVALDTRADEALQKLPRAAAANYDASLQCLVGTRMDILDRIFEWIDNTESGRNVFWLKAIAGSGKSTIASTVASHLDSEQGAHPRHRSLGAAFFCKRDDEELRRPDLLWSTIAFHLAHAYAPLKPYILHSIDVNPDIGKSPIANQFQKLIVGPLSSFKPSSSEATPAMVIVIDALDECGDSSSRDSILRCLAGQFTTLPSWVKILVTSRPESDIKKSLNHVKDILPLDTSNQEQRSDVAKYIRHRIEEMKKDAVLKPDSLGPNKTEDLITRSDGLFIWARLSLDFISKHRNPEKALDFVLSDVSSSTTSDRHDHRQLDILYGTVLHDACKDGVDPGRESQENTELILRVLGSAVVARVPLSFANLSCLIADGSFDATEIVWAIERLGSVLPTHGDSQIVRVIHPSFIDFLTTKKRAQTFFIDTSDFNLSMCRASLQLMHRELKHDICAIGDASLLNTEIPTTKRRTLYEKRPLLYSCQFWGDHLADSQSIVDDVVALVELFFMQHLLEWFEVLSLADALECALPALAKIEASFNELSRALADERRMTTISLGCRDATRFLRYHYSIIRLSALHAYISALAFTPSKSWIAQQYIPKYLPPLRVTVGVDHFWSPQVLIFDRHEWQVLAARFSPDKRNIASIDDYGTIHVWNTDSGHIFLTMSYPYLYDGCNTGSLSFSPDGKHLVTEIRGYPTLVWSTETGDKYERQLQERSGGPVSWSLDGRFIVSVDGDGHGMVWSGTTFEIIEKAFESVKGHGRIHRVEFSSDSKWLATAASDGSTHIRDVQTWDEIHRTMDATYSEGGERDFVALAFSPDRRKLAWFPGDRDKVTIWDIERDTISHLPIRHPDDGSEGRSLVFSPDGSTLVVGCESGLLTVRDVATGTILHDLKGHGVRVNGVEFANMASNTMLLSYSNDRTVRLWDVGTVNLSTGSSDEGPMSVHCSISADGRSLAAWDDDGPCFIWDTRTGTKLQLPYVSDGMRVNLAIFSPDRRRLAILDVNEELLFLWDVENRTALPCSIPADEVKAWAAAAICNLSVKVEPSLMSFSPDGPQQTHSSDMSQLVAIWTEAYDDGWIYAGTDSSRMRLCYLPALHRTSYEPFFPRKCMTGAGTHVATICIAAHFRLTILDLEGLLRMVPQSYRFLGEHAVNLPQLYSSMSDDATSALGKSCEDAGSHRPYLGMKYDFHGRE